MVGMAMGYNSPKLSDARHKTCYTARSFQAQPMHGKTYMIPTPEVFREIFGGHVPYFSSPFGGSTNRRRWVAIICLIIIIIISIINHICPFLKCGLHHFAWKTMTPLIGKKTFQRAEIIQLLSANIVASYLKFSAMQMLNNSILREIWKHKMSPCEIQSRGGYESV